MTVELGHFSLVLALGMALVQSVLPLLGARTGDARLMEAGSTTSVTGLALIALAFGALTAAM